MSAPIDHRAKTPTGHPRYGVAASLDAGGIRVGTVGSNPRLGTPSQIQGWCLNVG